MRGLQYVNASSARLSFTSPFGPIGKGGGPEIPLSDPRGSKPMSDPDTMGLKARLREKYLQSL